VGFAELILTGSWYLWWERRKFVHEGTVQNPTRSAVAIASLTINYLRATKKTVKVKSGWKKPPEDFLMLNVDASFNYIRSTGSTGAVLRDSAGSFVAAAANFFEHILDAPMAEAMALREGIALTQLIGCCKLVIHSNSQGVVETMQQGGSSATASAPIFEDCAYRMEDSSCSIEHCNRDINVVAHEVARVVMESELNCIWVDEPPSFILEHLVNDVILFGD